jgi:Trk K+ transport system NAD-binding subunit
MRRTIHSTAKIRAARSDQPATDDLREPAPPKGGAAPARNRRGLGAHVRYRFDTAMAKGPSRVLLWLGAVTVVFAVAGGLVLLSTQANTGAGKTLKDFFLSLVATVDGGGEIGLTGGFTGNAWYLAVSFVLGFGGLVIVSAFIGLLATIMTEQAERLRKGRSVIIERDHTLVLGWSGKVFDVVSELVEANRNQRRACVVILADQDAAEMNDALKERITDRGPTKIVCRRGDPSDPVSLDIVRAEDARSVIVLSESEGDASAIRTTLALMQRDPGLLRLRLVVEVNDPHTARILSRVTDDRISTVVSAEVVARITAQVCRQPGLSAIYQDFLDFDGDEIYFTSADGVAGATFSQALLAYPTASVIGLRRADGSIVLDPPGDTVIEPDDAIIAVAEDDDRLTVGAVPAPTPVPDRRRPAVPVTLEHILIIGWNALGPLVLGELDTNVAAGSTALVLVDPVLLGSEPTALPVTTRLTVTVDTLAGGLAGDALERVITATHFDHIVLLCYRGDRSVAESDAQTLLTLLQLRDLLADRDDGGPVPSIATELLDSRDVHLARLEHSDDFVVSERLTSLMMSQLSENPALRMVFDDLFSPTGTQLTLEPAQDYAPLDEDLTYEAVIRGGIAMAGIVIGWRVAAADGSGPVVRLNPAKSDVIRFGPSDQVIVMRSSRHRPGDDGGVPVPVATPVGDGVPVEAAIVAALPA